MAKLTREQVAALRADRANGMTPKALQDKYGISKRTVYNYIGGSGDATVTEAPPTEEEKHVSFNEPSVEVDEDPIIDFEKMESNAAAPMRESIFEMKDDIDSVFDIKHLLREERDGPPPPKLNVNKLVKGRGSINDGDKTPEDIKKEAEQERLKLVYQVRLYLYTFKDCDNLFLALNVEQQDKKINKFIQDLYRRKTVELVKLLDFIKFHIRHNNNQVHGNFCSGIFFTVTKMMELILSRIGFDITGLTDDLRNDRDIVSNLKEIEIEMTAGRFNVGPKTDVLLKLCQASLSKYTQNKLISKMKQASSKQTIGVAMDKLQSKPPNVDLEKKYDDL